VRRACCAVWATCRVCVRGVLCVFVLGGLEQINHNAAFTLPVLSLVVITILNDGTIITIAYDKVIPENTPQKWDMGEVQRCRCLLVSKAPLCLRSPPPPHSLFALRVLPVVLAAPAACKAWAHSCARCACLGR
jgi:hypothetical protein